MVIGISGKIGSGKDTVASIIQYLTHEFEIHGQINQSYEDFLKLKYDQAAFSWKIKKFADNLKDIVCLLTGCTREDLEKQEFKDSLLADDLQVFSITNWGKNAGVLHKLQFSTEVQVKVFCDIHSNSQHQYEYKKSERTYRWMLQQLGTELLRERIHDNIHIHALFSRYVRDKQALRSVGSDDELQYGVLPKWIITDTRFPNEAEAIKKREGILIRVNRGHGFIPAIPSTHPSETALDNASFDYVIENNGTIEELVEKVKQILTELKLI